MTSKIVFIPKESPDGEYMDYTIRIPLTRLIELDFTDKERRLLSMKESPISQILLGLHIIVEKMEDKPINNTQEQMINFHKRYGMLELDLNDLNNMFVDHLVINLEKRSVGGILKFLAKYCGWYRIIDFINKEKNDG